MGYVRERFNPIPMAANANYNVTGMHIGGFLAKTSGTITVVSKNAQGTADVTLVDAVPVTAGIYTPLPMIFPAVGATVTLAGGASGTLLV